MSFRHFNGLYQTEHFPRKLSEPDIMKNNRNIVSGGSAFNQTVFGDLLTTAGSNLRKVGRIYL